MIETFKQQKIARVERGGRMVDQIIEMEYEGACEIRVSGYKNALFSFVPRRFPFPDQGNVKTFLLLQKAFLSDNPQRSRKSNGRSN